MTVNKDSLKIQADQFYNQIENAFGSGRNATSSMHLSQFYHGIMCKDGTVVNDLTHTTEPYHLLDIVKRVKSCKDNFNLEQKAHLSTVLNYMSDRKYNRAYSWKHIFGKNFLYIRRMCSALQNAFHGLGFKTSATLAKNFADKFAEETKNEDLAANRAKANFKNIVLDLNELDTSKSYGSNLKVRISKRYSTNKHVFHAHPRNLYNRKNVKNRTLIKQSPTSEVKSADVLTEKTKDESASLAARKIVKVDSGKSNHFKPLRVNLKGTAGKKRDVIKSTINGYVKANAQKLTSSDSSNNLILKPYQVVVTEHEAKHNRSSVINAVVTSLIQGARADKVYENKLRKEAEQLPNYFFNAMSFIPNDFLLVGNRDIFKKEIEDKLFAGEIKKLSFKQQANVFNGLDRWFANHRILQA
ncbi:MAG: hypothetical protein JHC93_05090 [Parachlamydiales bacterium]|nr:hypothetical protein [Parachlamydiales bacterium]